MVFNKKAISPVVATALLLVVAVVAVVGFQTWFNTYQSGLNTKIEQQSAAGSVVTIERLENASGTASVYLKNSGKVDLTTVSVTTKTGSCTNSSFTLTGDKLSVIPLSSCALITGDVYEVVVITKDQVYSGKQIAR